MSEVMNASSILVRTASLPPPPFATVQAFIGRVPVAVQFDPDLPLRKSGPDCGLSHSRVGQHFVEVLTAEYEGRLLTTDVECEAVSSWTSSVVLGYSRGARSGGPSWVHHQFPNVSPRLQRLASGKLNLKRTEDLGCRDKMVQLGQL